MKGIALSIIVYFLIALVSISLIVMYVSGTMPEQLKSIYCSFALGISGILPFPESMKPSAPSFCKVSEIGKLGQVVTIESDKPSFIARKIAEHSLACWEVTGKINVGQDKNCYELVLKNLDGYVNENFVKSYLPKDYKNILDWQAGTITKPKSVGIYYDADKKLIVVI